MGLGVGVSGCCRVVKERLRLGHLQRKEMWLFPGLLAVREHSGSSCLTSSEVLLMAEGNEKAGGSHDESGSKSDMGEESHTFKQPDGV